jgi:hypothetical protein
VAEITGLLNRRTVFKPYRGFESPLHRNEAEAPLSFLKGVFCFQEGDGCLYSFDFLKTKMASARRFASLQASHYQ